MPISPIIAVLPILAVSSLRESAFCTMFDLARASNPTNGLCRFLDYESNARRGCFVANTNFWLKGIDFTCVSPWNSGGGCLRAGTLISKRHIVYAKHFPLWKDVRILFTDGQGGDCYCSIDATKEISGSDIAVGLLNAEVTPNIQPAKILPADYSNYIGNGDGFQVVTFNRSEKAYLTELNGEILLPHLRAFNCRMVQDQSTAQYRGWFVTGDSGNPAFLMMGRQPILIYCLKGGACGAGPAIHRYRKEIQKAMDELCPGYKLEVFDFAQVKNEK